MTNNFNSNGEINGGSNDGSNNDTITSNKGNKRLHTNSKHFNEIFQCDRCHGRFRRNAGCHNPPDEEPDRNIRGKHPRRDDTAGASGLPQRGDAQGIIHDTSAPDRSYSARFASFARVLRLFSLQGQYGSLPSKHMLIYDVLTLRVVANP